jgi:restriction endonuclease Mrr
MAVYSDDTAFIEQAIKAEVRVRVEAEIKKQAEEAAEKVRAKLKDEVDRIALSVMRHYDMQSMGDRIVITVRNDVAPKP